MRGVLRLPMVIYHSHDETNELPAWESRKRHKKVDSSNQSQPFRPSVPLSNLAWLHTHTHMDEDMQVCIKAIEKGISIKSDENYLRH